MKGVLLALIFLAVVPIAFAAEIQSIDLDIEINVTSTNSSCFFTILINGEDDNDFEEIDCDSNKSFTDTFRNVDIEVTTTDSEIADLTKALIASNEEATESCRNSKNLTSGYLDCVEGRTKAATIKDQYKAELDTCNNDSGKFRLLYENESTASLECSSKFGVCNTNLLNRNTEYNTCIGNLSEAEKKTINLCNLQCNNNCYCNTYVSEIKGTQTS